MAGSRSSPVLRDDWRVPTDNRDRQGRGKPRGSDRDRGRRRGGWKERHIRSRDAPFDRPPQSPPPSRSFPGPGREAPRKYRESSPSGSVARGSPGPPPRGLREDQRVDVHPSSNHEDFERHRFQGETGFEGGTGTNIQRGDLPSVLHPPKRKRTRSPSPQAHHNPTNFRRGRPSRRRGDRDRSPPQKRRGRFPGRGAFPRGEPRGRGRGENFDRFGPSRRRFSRSPVRGARRTRPSPRGRIRSSPTADYSDKDSLYRSPSRDSVQSRGSKLSVSSRGSRNDHNMSETRPIRSIVDESARSPSPLRPIPSFGSDDTNKPTGRESGRREAFPMHGMRAPDVRGNQRPRPVRPHADSGQYATSPQYAPSVDSRHGSPQSVSSYSDGRGGWVGQPPYHMQHSNSPYRQSNYQGQSAPQGQYFQNQQGQFNDRRFSGAGPQGYNNGPPPRARGHFSNLQWTASGSRSQSRQDSPLSTSAQQPQSPPSHSMTDERMSPDIRENDHPFRSLNKDSQVEGEHLNQRSENGESQNIPPHSRQPSTSSSQNKGGKFSFALKSKAAPAPMPKPVPDLAQRMQARVPPPRAAEPRSKIPPGPSPKFKRDTRFDRHDRNREGHRDRGRDWHRDKDGRRDFRDPRNFREFREGFDGRDFRKDDRRFGHHEDRRKDRRPDYRGERRLEPTPELTKRTKIITRVKPRPTLPDEYAKSESVYYRKPGNESVIGAGTYGKVFKAVHIYTKKEVALKRIRMEGERDGFPVTAVREIKLLQHLRSHNVVSLLEVMVEKNECFMVFEYLSHDLTGLINHPTFTLTAAHKKNLAKQMFEGLNYLHHRGILHRDIKAANILISNRGLLKFADFGLARFFSKSRQLDYTNRVITIWYRPPELLLGETRYGPSVDIWSAACVYIEMFTKKAVFPGEGGEISQLDKLYNCLGTPTRAEWPDIVEMPWFELLRPTERKSRVFEDLYRDILSPAALDLMAQIFRYDPAKRPTAEEILAHPYFLSEEPRPQQAVELENIDGDWHEFESKALRKGRDKEARRAEYNKEKEKRKACSMAIVSEREAKRAKPDMG